jgi:hypothetical protein
MQYFVPEIRNRVCTKGFGNKLFKSGTSFFLKMRFSLIFYSPLLPTVPNLRLWHRNLKTRNRVKPWKVKKIDAQGKSAPHPNTYVHMYMEDCALIFSFGGRRDNSIYDI